MGQWVSEQGPCCIQTPVVQGLVLTPGAQVVTVLEGAGSSCLAWLMTEQVSGSS